MRWTEIQTEFFPFEVELDFSKGTLFFHLEDKLIHSLPWKTNWFIPSLGRQTEFFPLEDELDFSKGIPLNFFTWKTNWIFPLEDKLNFSKSIPLNFFPLEDKLNFSKGTYYLWIFSLRRQSEFLKGYPWIFFVFEIEIKFTEISKLLTQTHTWTLLKLNFFIGIFHRSYWEFYMATFRTAFLRTVFFPEHLHRLLLKHDQYTNVTAVSWI